MHRGDWKKKKTVVDVLGYDDHGFVISRHLRAVISITLLCELIASTIAKRCIITSKDGEAKKQRVRNTYIKSHLSGFYFYFFVDHRTGYW